MDSFKRQKSNDNKMSASFSDDLLQTSWLALGNPWFIDRVALEITAVMANRLIQASATLLRRSCSSIMSCNKTTRLENFLVIRKEPAMILICLDFSWKRSMSEELRKQFYSGVSQCTEMKR